MRSLRNPFGTLPPEVAVRTAVAFSVALGVGIVAPALPRFAEAFVVSNSAPGAGIAVFAAGRLASARAAGSVTDRAGGGGGGIRRREAGAAVGARQESVAGVALSAF